MDITKFIQSSSKVHPKFIESSSKLKHKDKHRIREDRHSILSSRDSGADGNIPSTKILFFLLRPLQTSTSSDEWWYWLGKCHQILNHLPLGTPGIHCIVQYLGNNFTPGLVFPSICRGDWRLESFERDEQVGILPGCSKRFPGERLAKWSLASLVYNLINN